MKTCSLFGSIVLALILVPPATAYPQSLSVPTRATDPALSIQRAEIDSLRAQIAMLQRGQTQEYISTLENTNQQLSLWFNPYGILIGSLAVLFALLAIVATVLIYRQSKDYKEKLDTFVKGYQDIFDKLIKEWQARRDGIDKQIQDYQTQLAKTTGQQKKTIEDAIEKLKAQKDSVSSQIATTVAAMPSSGAIASLLGYPTKQHHKCSQCGWGFMVDPPYQSSYGTSYQGLTGLTMTSATVTCPKCGNVDQLYL